MTVDFDRVFPAFKDADASRIAGDAVEKILGLPIVMPVEERRALMKLAVQQALFAYATVVIDRALEGTDTSEGDDLAMLRAAATEDEDG